MAADGTFPRPDLAFGPAQDKGEIGFFGFPILELPAEFAMGGIGLSRHQNP